LIDNNINNMPTRAADEELNARFGEHGVFRRPATLNAALAQAASGKK
jgi:hypothetical protein